MNKKLLIIGIFIVVVLSTITLSKSPLPWFDEIFFADVTNNLIKSGKLELNVIASKEGSPVYIYGFLYFLIQKYLAFDLGISMLQFRLVNFISGILVVFLLFVRLRNSIGLFSGLIFLLLAFSDPIFISNSHSGRMDLLVLLLSLISWIYSEKFNKKGGMANVFISGCLISLTLLTSPRGLFLLAPSIYYVLNGFYRIIKTKKQLIFQFVLFLSAGIIPFLIHVLFFTGGFSFYIAEFLNPTAKSHFGISLLREIYEMPAIILSLILGSWILKKEHRSQNSILILVTILFFLIFVKAVGPYTAMIMPFCYFLILFSFSYLNIKKYIKVAMLTLLIMSNISIFIVKTSSVLLSWENRNIENIAYQDLKIVTSKVISPFKFYYYFNDKKIDLVANEFIYINDSAFYSFVLNSNAEFLIADNFTEKKSWYKNLHLNNNLVMLGSSKPLPKQDLVFLNKIEQKFGLRLTQDYNFKLFKIVRN